MRALVLRADSFGVEGVDQPTDPENCTGGRCCTYAPQYDGDLNEPIENWAPYLTRQWNRGYVDEEDDEDELDL